MLTRSELRDLILDSLTSQGFQVSSAGLRIVNSQFKEQLRQLHTMAVQHRVHRAAPGLRRHEDKLLLRIANGTDVAPDRINPKLVEVHPDTEDELLFRYARLHWSIPVSSGYGRRLRFLIIDQSNRKLIGLLGLGDPVFSIDKRDTWIGWHKQDRVNRLHHVIDAFVLGAVPPYSNLLCGKLIALLATSSEVRHRFQQKYSGRQSLIHGRTLDGRIALITTTSALGRSSIYNRIRFRKRLVYLSTGFTKGSGDFHFSNGIYDTICSHIKTKYKPTAKHSRWGDGFRNRREIIKKCLDDLSLPTDLLYHGVEREIFVAPLAHNTQQFLRGQEKELHWFEQPTHALFTWFRDRWLLPRAARTSAYRDFHRSSYRIWGQDG